MSNITNHAKSKPHKTAMMYMYFHRDQAKSRNMPITSYSPVAHSILSSSMDPAVREQVKKTFDISSTPLTLQWWQVKFYCGLTRFRLV